MTTYESPYLNTDFRWLRGNLHLHTCCGPYVDPAVSGEQYAQLGYHFMAITDHDRCPEGTEWERWLATAPLLLIPGVERSVPEHILNIGVTTLEAHTGGDYGESARQLVRQGGFVVGCHPQEYNDGPDLIRRAASSLHALEIFNGLRKKRGCHEEANVVLWDELLTSGERIWAVATDDFHQQYISPGNGWITVQIPHEIGTVTWQDLVAQLKVGAFYASTGPAFESLLWDGEILDVTVSLPCSAIQVLGPEGRLLIKQHGATMRWKAPAGLRYFRVEAIYDGSCAWSQPFINPSTHCHRRVQGRTNWRSNTGSEQSPRGDSLKASPHKK